MTGRAVAARWVLPAAVLAVGALAGCGGGDGTPQNASADSRQAEQRWIERVDQECEKVNDAIAGRGWPADLVDLDRLVVRAIDDVRGGTDAIAKLRIPEGAGPQPGRFVEEVEALDAELEQLSAASEELAPELLIDAADALKVRLVRIEKLGSDLGLRKCLTHDERQFVPDAVLGPVFAEQLAALDRRLLRRIKRIDFAEAQSPDALASMFRRYGKILDDAVAGIQKLNPPQWAARQTALYQRSLLDLQGATQEFETVLEVDDRSKLARADRKLQKAAGAEAAARKRMIRALGAAPTTRGAPQEEVEPETEEVA